MLKVGDYFVNFVFVVVGWVCGGLVKVVIFVLGLMGMINGIFVGNVVLIGLLIILLMKKVGYYCKIVGVVEVVVLIGG